MKCQICGKNEVNFHYSSNINGCVTETHMCAECAGKQGFDLGQLFDVRSAIGDFFPLFGGQPGFSAFAAPVIGFGAPSALRMLPMYTGEQCNAETGGCNCGKAAADVWGVEIDDEMKERRELRMQMQSAAEKEDFETAALLRDKIKELERGHNEI